jgi:hypothetical protein
VAVARVEPAVLTLDRVLHVRDVVAAAH